MREAPAKLEAKVPTIGVEQMLGAAATVIDLRSPGEHREDRVPGSTNVPLFDDVQRALVGTLYRKTSPGAAFEHGRAIVRARIRGLVREIEALTGEHVAGADLEERVDRLTAPGLERMEAELTSAPLRACPESAIVLHCRRGGLRSRSVVAFLRALGLDRVVGLEGGYAAWRRHVQAVVDAPLAPPAFVLRGLTGVGKTLVLAEIESLRPGWTLDLEDLAAHRSSLLGMVGLDPRPQKLFESLIAERVRRGFPGVLVLEGESRKVGDVTIPLGVWRALCAGTDVLLVASLERRIAVLEEAYLADERSRAELLVQLPLVEARMKRRVRRGLLVERLLRGETAELVGLLLERYYDPLYRRDGRGREHAATFDAGDPRAAAHEIVAWIETRLCAARPHAVGA